MNEAAEEKTSDQEPGAKKPERGHGAKWRYRQPAAQQKDGAAQQKKKIAEGEQDCIGPQVHEGEEENSRGHQHTRQANPLAKRRDAFVYKGGVCNHKSDSKTGRGTRQTRPGPLHPSCRKAEKALQTAAVRPAANQFSYSHTD
ncbi:MAG: hypothetical protein U5J99_04900 [Parvularculaceae bacterium]|nr:hypothetical protein [Parvularculaceae bacterium]